MSDDPVVETINAILGGEDNFILLVQRPQLERIRDEIVALRARCAQSDVDVLIETGRNEALDEAARVADGYCTDRTDDVARGIRALKER